uniref:Uncharacterized protein n=1 Tax=Arundo donax TaxID=35708 RepID=A0A0A9C553_ARUDO
MQTTNLSWCNFLCIYLMYCSNYWMSCNLHTIVNHVDACES